MAQDLACVIGLPGLAGSLGPVLLVQADEQVDQFAAHGPCAQQVRQLGQVDEPLGVPGGPVIVGPVDDPENTMVSLARLMQQAADLLQCVRHLSLPGADGGVAMRRPAVAAAGVIMVIMSGQARWQPARDHDGSYTACPAA